MRKIRGADEQIVFSEAYCAHYYSAFHKSTIPLSDAIRYFAVISSVHDPERLQPLGIFANHPYLARMPLDIPSRHSRTWSQMLSGTRLFRKSDLSRSHAIRFFAVSSSGSSVTLSHVALALRHPSKITVFDAKPPLSEAVTLSPPKLFFGNQRIIAPQSQIINVTASNISLSVKKSNGTAPRNPWFVKVT